MILLQVNDLHQAPGEPPPEGEETGGGRREDYRRKESPPKPNMRASLLLYTFLLALAGLTAVQSARRQPARMETSLNDIVSHHARRLFRRLHQTLKKEIDQFQVSGEGAHGAVGRRCCDPHTARRRGVLGRRRRIFVWRVACVS